MYTGNVSFIEESWSNIQAQADRLLGLMGTNDSLIRIDEVRHTQIVSLLVETRTNVYC